MKNVFLNVRTAKAQAGCAKLKDTSLSFRRGLGRGFLFTFLLLTFGVGQIWAETVLFFQDNIGMSGRFAYFYSNTYWDTNNGAGSNGITSQCNTMTKLGSNGSKDIYVYQISNNCSKVAVMQNSQSNYGNFWETQGCAATQPTNSDEYDGYWTAANPMMIPNQSSSYTKNRGKTTYYHFSWGTPTVWLKHANWDGNNWGWKQMTYNSDGTFTLDANYTNGSGCDRNCTNDGSGATYMDSPTKTPNSTWNHLARFKMTFSGGTINLSITKLCVVTFNMNGHGSAIAAKNVLYNTKVTAPSDPSASGYTFGGWYTNEGCTSPFDFANTNLTDDITLHAKWTPVTWKLQSTSGDHGTFTGTGPYTLDVTYNSATMNWGAARFDLNGTSYICNNYTIGTSGKLALRAENAYTAITGMTNGGSYTFTITKESGTWKVQIAANCTTPTIAWNTTPSNGTAGGSMTASVTTNQTSPTITWNSSDPSVATVNSSGVITYVAAGSTRITASYTGNGSTHCATTVSVYRDITVENNNYTWKLKQDNTELGTFSSDGNNTYHLDFEVTAGYNSNLHFVSTEASIDHAPSSETHLGSANKRTMVNDGGKNSWNDGIGKYRFYIQKISSTWYLYAERLYSVSYNGNSQSSGTAPSTTYHLAGSNVTVASNSGSLAKTGYDFGGWNENSSGTGTNYAAGSGVISSISADKNLFAKWTAQNYTITYKDKGGEAFSGVHGSGYPTSHTYGSVTNLVSPTKANYIFGGWCETSDCNGDVVTSIGATAKTAAFTLYAKWVPAAPSAALLAGNFPELNNWGNCGTMTKSTSGSTTTFTYTLYDVAAGTYEFCLKPSGGCGGSTAILKPAQNYVVTQTQTGCTSFGESGDSNHNFKVVTGSAGDITITVTYNSSTPSVNVDVTRVTPATTSSGWYMIGDPFNGWTSTNYPMDNVYRGISGVYYRPWTISTSGQYYKVAYNGTQYGQTEAGDDVAVVTGTQYSLVATKAYKTAFITNNNGSIWCVVDDNNKKMWVQSPTTYHTVSKSSEHGTVKLKEKIYGGLETNQFAYGETIRVEIDTVAHYSINTVTLSWGVSSSTTVSMSKSGTKYVGDVVMPNSDATLTVTYTPWYKVQLEVGTVKGNARTPKIYLGSTSSESNVISSGSYVAAGSKVIFWIANDAGSAPAAGYNWWGFYDNATGANPTKYTNNTVSLHTINSIAADAHVYAVFGENDYWITPYINGQGSISPNGANAHIATPTEFTANPGTGYMFDSWEERGGSAMTIESPSVATTNVTTTAAATLQANFSPRWSVIGTGAFGGWSAYNTNLFTGYTVVSTKDVGYKSITLAANTSYEIKVYDRLTSTTYGGSAVQTIDYAHSGAVNEYTVATTASPKSVTIQSAAGGTYTLNWNLTDKKIAVVYPTSWYITTGQKTTGQDDNAGGSFTAVETTNSNVDVKGGKFVANNATVTCTASPNTGYTFGGWYSESTCTTAYVNGTGGAAISGAGGVVLTLSSITADKTVYAKFTPKTYTITLTRTGTGYGSGGQANLTATYDAPFPSITLPTAAEGYAFMGYYSEANGAGTQFTNASGVLLANITDYSDEDGNWIYDGIKTLYAYYKKSEITAVVLNHDIFEPVAEATGVDDKDYVFANPTIEPTPVLPVKICWELLYDNGNSVPAGHEAIDDHDGSHPNRVKFSIAGLAAGGYKIKATLRTGDDCSGGTLLSEREVSFTIASGYTVTIQYKDSEGNTIAPSTTSPGKATDWTSISAPTIVGYNFSTWVPGDGITLESSATKNNNRFKATFNGTLTARYTKKGIIYFKNTLGWSDVYVNFMSGDYWNTSKGSGNGNTYHSRNNRMTLMPGTTDVYYFEYSGTTTAYVSFTSTSQTADNFWAEGGVNVVFPTRPDASNTDRASEGFGYNAGTPMFVPLSGQSGVEKNNINGGKAYYFNKGYWVDYNPISHNTGYTLEIYNHANADGSREVLKTVKFYENGDGALEATVDLDAATTYAVKFLRDNNMRYTNVGGANLTDGTSLKFEFNADNWAARTLVSTAAGSYVFKIRCNSDGYLYVTATYPAAANDFQILYNDNAEWSLGSAHSATWIHPSRIIRARENGVDTISFFVAKDNAPILKARKVNSINASTGAITWGSLNINGAETQSLSVDSSAVYNFKVTQGATAGDIASIEYIGPYTGNYYIRCNALNSNWDNYTTDGDHRMTYSSFSESNANSFGEKYSHYKAKWCPRNTNIAFCIANDYSPCITDTLKQDVPNTYENTESDGTLKYEKSGSSMKYNDNNAYLDRYSANVRFMWNRKTNKISRAYVSASTSTNAKFLVLQGSGATNANIYDGSTGAAFTANPPGKNSVKLSDNENWIYEVTVKANPSALVKLYANYCGQTQWFRGAAGGFTEGTTAIQILGGSASASQYSVRVIYDFKTNRLIAAWVPSGSSETIDTDLIVNADVMIVREHQESAQCITFSNDAKMTSVKNVYGVMRFNRWILNNRQYPENQNKDEADLAHHPPLSVGQQKSTYERRLYFISFPFDVLVGDIFGFGTYGQYWVIQYYDGLNRAKKGYWMDSKPNWKYVSPTQVAQGYKLEKNQGYILELNLSAMAADNTTFWSNGISTIELYFPSTVNQDILKQTNCTIPALSDEYECKINRGTTEGDRRVKDSYWRCIGVPSYNLYNSALKDGSGNTITWKTEYTWQEDESEFPFIYMWNKTDNTLTPQATSTFTFQPMHAYLTQIKNAIVWTAVSAKPSSIVARRAGKEATKEYNWRIELKQDTTFLDQTYVRMTDLEQVTDSFDFGQDLIKELNSRSNIYTFIGYEKVAANSMTLHTDQTTVIPVGANITTEGDYTFAMPDGADGIGVTLIDAETGTHTNLSAGMDYTVYLEKGTHDNRFWLEISPIQNTPTDIELINGENGDASLNGVRKVLIDGILYIVKDGKLFDARGARVE